MGRVLIAAVVWLLTPWGAFAQDPARPSPGVIVIQVQGDQAVLADRETAATYIVRVSDEVNGWTVVDITPVTVTLEQVVDGVRTLVPLLVRPPAVTIPTQ